MTEEGHATRVAATLVKRAGAPDEILTGRTKTTGVTGGSVLGC